MESSEQYGRYVRFIKSCNERIANVNDCAIAREFIRNVEGLQDVSIEELAERGTCVRPTLIWVKLDTRHSLTNLTECNETAGKKCCVGILVVTLQNGSKRSFRDDSDWYSDRPIPREAPLPAHR